MRSVYEQEYKLTTDNKVINLVKQFNKTKDEAYKKMYLIIKEIWDLRKKENQKYNMEDLAREKGLDISIGTIKYLFGYEHFTEQTKKLISEEKINERTALFLIRRSKKFQEQQNQNLVISKIVNKKLNVTEISNCTSDEILKRAASDKGISDKEQYFLDTYYQIRRIKYRINSYKDYFLTSKRKNKLVNYLNELVKEIEDES